MSSKDGRLALLETGFEGYPDDYVTHNVPLVVLSGLPTNTDETLDLPPSYRDGALKIHGELPPVTGQSAEDLVRAFQAYERKPDQWDAKPVVEGSNVMGFRFRVTGRVSMSPP